MLINQITDQGNHCAKYKHSDTRTTKIFGFWIYLMSDCILFAVLFATYTVLQNNTVEKLTNEDIFNLPFILVETFFLLFSSITYGMAILSTYKDDKNLVNVFLSLTFILGFIFICMEIYEFHHLITKGYGPNRNAFLSSFFTLVGTHGLHVTAGLIWILVMIIQVFYRGLTPINQTRLQCLSLFWHFLDIIWICVFSIVYLLGSL